MKGNPEPEQIPFQINSKFHSYQKTKTPANRKTKSHMRNGSKEKWFSGWTNSIQLKIEIGKVIPIQIEYVNSTMNPFILELSTCGHLAKPLTCHIKNKTINFTSQQAFYVDKLQQ